MEIAQNREMFPNWESHDLDSYPNVVIESVIIGEVLHVSIAVLVGGEGDSKVPLIINNW